LLAFSFIDGAVTGLGQRDRFELLFFAIFFVQIMISNDCCVHHSVDGVHERALF